MRGSGSLHATRQAEHRDRLDLDRTVPPGQLHRRALTCPRAGLHGSRKKKQEITEKMTKTTIARLIFKGAP
jgi:hypothetical protein